MTLLELSGASLERGGRTVLAGADWRLAAGELHVVTGASGSGKSALLLLAGLALGPDAGEVSLFGAPAPAPRASEAEALRARIGQAAQTPAFLEHLSLGENVALPLRLAGLAPEARRTQAAELLDWLGLTGRAADLPAALSASERRRAALARAVIASPELILADEPSAELDRGGAAQALEMLAALAEHGAGVAVATSDPELVRLARHQGGAKLWRIDEGRLERGAAT